MTASSPTAQFPSIPFPGHTSAIVTHLRTILAVGKAACSDKLSWCSHTLRRSQNNSSVDTGMGDGTNHSSERGANYAFVSDTTNSAPSILLGPPNGPTGRGVYIVILFPFRLALPPSLFSISLGMVRVSQGNVINCNLMPSHRHPYPFPPHAHPPCPTRPPRTMGIPPPSP